MNRLSHVLDELRRREAAVPGLSVSSTAEKTGETGEAAPEWIECTLAPSAAARSPGC